MYKQGVVYLAVAGVMLVIFLIALVFILGMRAMAQSRSDDDERHR
jgi:hypothetical protein